MVPLKKVRTKDRSTSFSKPGYSFFFVGMKYGRIIFLTLLLSIAVLLCALTGGRFYYFSSGFLAALLLFSTIGQILFKSAAERIDKKANQYRQ